MTDERSFREERIEKLLKELRYEIERGLMEREIGEEMHFRFIFPISHKIPGGCVLCCFDTKPITGVQSAQFNMEPIEPKLRVVE